MVCKQCGIQLPEEAKFCSNCGCLIANEPAVPAETPQVEAQPEIPAKAPVSAPAEAPVEVPAEVPAKVKKEAPAKAPKTKVVKKQNRFLRGFVSVICCLMIFIFSLTTLLTLVVRNTLAEENIDTLIENVDIEDIANEDTLEDIADSVDFEFLEEIYKIPSIRSYVKKIALQYTNYLRGGEEPNGIEADEIEKLMDKNADEFEEILGGPLNPNDYDDMREFFEEDAEENLGVLSSDVRTNGVLSAVRIVLSVGIIILLAAITLLFVFLLFKARRFRLDSMVWTAVPLILAGLIVCIFGSIKAIVLSFAGGVLLVEEIISLVMSSMLSAVLTNSIICILIGVLLIVVYIIVKKIIAARAAKKASAEIDSALA